MNNKYRNHLCIVFAIEHYNPLGIIRSLGEAGVNPVYIAVNGRVRVASASKYISKCFPVESVEEGYDVLIKEFGDVYESEEKPLIFCSDDKTIGFLDQQYNSLKDRFLFYNAGKNGRINEFMDKKKILDLAVKHGVPVLKSRVLMHGEVPDDLEYPIITKAISPNSGAWKADVHICENAEELKTAYDNIESPEILVQRFINKKTEMAIEGFCANHGKDFFGSIQSNYQYVIKGYYSPFMYCKNFDDIDLGKKLNAMMEEIGYEGIFEIEFLVDQDDSLYFLEFNFRNSTWSYASTVAGMPLPMLWADGMIDGVMHKDIYRKVPDGFTAMVEPIDYAKRVKEGKIDLAQWLVDFKLANCGYYFNSDDIEPWKICVKNWDKLG